MDVKLTYEDRKKLYIDAVTWNKPKRVLFDMSMMTGFFQKDAGYSIAEATRDFDINKKCLEHFFEKYNVDAGGNAFRFKLRYTDPLRKGSSLNGLTEKSINDGNINIIVEDFLSVDDFEEFKNNPNKVLWEKVFFNAFPNAKNMSPEEIANAAKESSIAGPKMVQILNEMRDKYGVLYPKPGAISLTPFVHSLLYNYLGIRGLSIALRRNQEKVFDICDFEDEKSIANFKKILETRPDGPCAGIQGHYDCGMGTSEGAVLNQKMMERLVIRTYKPAMDMLQEKKKITNFGIEGSYLNSSLGDFLNQYTYVSVPCEIDSPYEVRKVYPNLAIRGGITVDEMGNASPQKCVDSAKRAIDTLGRDGGLILTTNKFVVYDYDMTEENLKAVGDFVTSYFIN